MDTLLLVNPYVIFNGYSLVLLANPYSGVDVGRSLVPIESIIRPKGYEK